MRQIADRLVADMRWRLTQAGKRHRPGRAEMASWGSAAIPPLGTIGGGCATQVLMLGAMFAAFEIESIFLAILSIGIMLVAWPAAFLITQQYQWRADLKAYSKLVQANERFALVEYSKLLHRQIHAARTDPALGGPAEIKRLSDLQLKINELLHDGAGGQISRGSKLSAEADLAESIIEAYSTGKDDGLAALDSRLPQELRARLDDLDREAGDAKTQRERA